ncbi:Mg-protoporphyrin IX methyltransferase [Synechococcus sp. PCC 7502]|uniref:magnesium protoporphyrin IX methyltransferase n=1 Tax=Synechococcus sp. PCC 7502 TaxID=1173263 RepID=UPI00029F8CFC|nr:magnesium protoporphyrin IX methyltransferase [Synechococcus sp. PCC 7502]AFY75342.1 Mg-protoporphyrin IX methyltransferase [Synechococcus sp. PCC 7502]
MTTGTNDKDTVRNYFNSVGFDRWRRIYGTDDVNKVQYDIRTGHQQTVDKVVAWLKADGNLAGAKICDAGCGVGSLSFPLAIAGAEVYGSDISEKMVQEAKNRAANANNPTFSVSDLESLTGEYDTVICLDVLIHYPLEEVEPMIKHLASLAKSKLILSFAPSTPYLDWLKKVGEFFPGASKATRAYLHPESEIRNILARADFLVKREEMTSTRFYFSRLLEANRRK